MKELNIRIEYPNSFKSQEVLSAVRDYCKAMEEEMYKQMEEDYYNQFKG